MENLIAPSKYLEFDFETYIKNDLDVILIDDKKGVEECKAFMKNGTCPKGNACPLRHSKSAQDRAVVCKHWLRGLCKKGEACEFLHEYNLKRMPECYFYSKYRECSNQECMYLHIDPESKVKECPWYNRGFCKHGPTCRSKHVRRIMCQLYLVGFCPSGKNCLHAHPKFDEILPSQQQQQSFEEPLKKDRSSITCYKCNQPGHYANSCTFKK